KWPLFEEDFTLVAHKDRALARRNEVELKDLAGETIFSRPYCEQGERLAAILEEADIDNWDAHRVVSEHDLLELLQANMGVAILPESFVAANDLRAIRLRGVEMRRTVHAYSVSGRQRSPAGSLLLKLLRGADWSAAGPGSMSRTAA
ncbi:MAG: LysR family transcriptional regulator substrate-binding protein, partial [Pseudomonadota bacterium]|nr:LysR family transcriptional regulator substrate-binding protein [Pseudomonadota bacterium]